MDSEAAITSAMGAAFREAGEEEPSYDAIRDVIGLSLDEAVGRLNGELKPPRAAAIVSAYRHNYAKLRHEPNLFPGVRETLRMLHEAGYLLAVATGKSKTGLAAAIEMTALGGVFHATRTADETEPKPSPAMLQEILVELDVRPEASLMVGDTAYDLAMGQLARTHLAGVAYGAHDVARLLPYKPAFILDQFAHLPAELDSLMRVLGNAS